MGMGAGRNGYINKDSWRYATDTYSNDLKSNVSVCPNESHPFTKYFLVGAFIVFSRPTYDDVDDDDDYGGDGGDDDGDDDDYDYDEFHIFGCNFNGENDDIFLFTASCGTNCLTSPSVH